MEERWYLIALHQITGVGWHTITHMLAAGWTPGNEISNSTYNCLRQNRVSKKVIERIKSKFRPSFVKQVKRECEERKIETVTRLDDAYPAWLAEISQPPWILYLRGDPTLLQTNGLAIVGTRKPTVYGRRMTKQFATELVKRDLTIVSGMAFGVDTEAHQSALAAGGNTIAVLGSGVDVIYPKRNRSLYQQLIKHGLVISESAPGTNPHPGLFPQRNRVISGLSLGTLVVEAAAKSGSLITANFSLEQGREVFAVPGPVNSPLSAGTLKLIQEGAKCVRVTDDILDELQYVNIPTDVVGRKMSCQAQIPKLNQAEETLLSHIHHEPVQITALLEELQQKLQIGEIHQSLLSLEMKQVITQLPGQHYIRC